MNTRSKVSGDQAFALLYMRPSDSHPMFTPFWRFTEQFVSFTPAEKSLIRDHLTVRDVPKHHVLVGLGEVAREVYFLNKGCMRFYYLTEEGREITGFVFQENMFAGSHESFVSQRPSTQILETLEACELLVLPYEHLETLYDSVPKMNVFVRKLYEQRMSYAQQVVASLIMNKPAERYTSLLELQPGLANRIPQQVLATYLGITPVSLSRIRRRIIDKE